MWGLILFPLLRIFCLFVCLFLENLMATLYMFSDTDSLVAGLQGCSRLKTLKIEGNPVHEDPDCR